MAALFTLEYLRTCVSLQMYINYVQSQNLHLKTRINVTCQLDFYISQKPPVWENKTFKLSLWPNYMICLVMYGSPGLFRNSTRIKTYFLINSKDEIWKKTVWRRLLKARTVLNYQAQYVKWNKLSEVVAKIRCHLSNTKFYPF